MSYQDKLRRIDELQQTINEYGKLPDDVLKKINYKFRLEWNYTSNSMEGNSLTRSETRSVMVGNITVDGKPIQDVLEMKGHDEIISEIIKVGKRELNISEKRIKEVHKGIMHEENPERQQYIGKWKSANNYLTNYKGERFDFVEHSEVPERMHQLINWLNAENDKIRKGSKDALHPVALAFQFHLDYIVIHPFYDGNGRTCRIFTNLILISYGYPPFYIKEKERELYYQYLADIQGYGGSPNLFYDFMSDLLIRSQEIVLDAIDGKDIEEDDDFRKEIELLSARLSTGNRIAKTPKLIKRIFDYSSITIWKEVLGALNSFDRFFGENKEVHYINESQEDKTVVRSLLDGPFTTRDNRKVKIFGVDIYEEEIYNIQWRQLLYGLATKKGSLTYEVALSISLLSEEYRVQVVFSNKPNHFLKGEVIYNISKPYEAVLLPSELDVLSTSLKKKILEQIKNDTE